MCPIRCEAGIGSVGVMGRMQEGGSDKHGPRPLKCALPVRIWPDPLGATNASDQRERRFDSQLTKPRCRSPVDGVVMRRTVQQSWIVELVETFERSKMARRLRNSWKCPDCGETSRREPHWSLAEHMKTRHEKEWDEQLGYVKAGRPTTDEESAEALTHNFFHNQFTEE